VVFWWLQYTAKRTLIFRFKRGRAGLLGQPDLSLAFTAEINAHIAVPVDILDNVAIEPDPTPVVQSNLHHRSSHSFFG
jgi:hypothetical protein